MKNKKFRISIIVTVIVAALMWPAEVRAVNIQNDSMVKNITIEGGTFSTEFKPGNDTYSVYLEEFQDPLNVIVELNDSRFQYEVDGEDFLKREENNIVVVDVTDPNGEYEDEKYKFNIFFEAAGLSYLGAEKAICSPQFDRFHTNYYLVLENEIDTFEAAGIIWHTTNSDAVVEVECVGELNEDGKLPEGERTQYNIIVYEKDGTSNHYQLFLYRKAANVSALNEEALLENIEINGGTVKVPTFREEKAFYEITVPSSITKLDIQAYPVDKRNVAEVIGSTVMKEDEPIYITIKVTSVVHDEESYYTLRCQYDTMTYTEKYTELQVSAYILCTLVLGCTVAGGVVVLRFKRKSKMVEREELIES